MRAFVVVVAVLLGPGCYADLVAVNPAMIDFPPRRLPRPAEVTWEDVSAAAMRVLIATDLEDVVVLLNDRAQVIRIRWEPVQERQAVLPGKNDAERLYHFPRSHRLRIQWEFDRTVSFTVDCAEMVRADPPLWSTCGDPRINADYAKVIMDLGDEIMHVAKERAAARLRDAKAISATGL